MCVCVCVCVCVVRAYVYSPTCGGAVVRYGAAPVQQYSAHRVRTYGAACGYGAIGRVGVVWVGGRGKQAYLGRGTGTGRGGGRRRGRQARATQEQVPRNYLCTHPPTHTTHTTRPTHRRLGPCSRRCYCRPAAPAAPTCNSRSPGRGSSRRRRRHCYCRHCYCRRRCCYCRSRRRAMRRRPGPLCCRSCYCHRSATHAALRPCYCYCPWRRPVRLRRRC